MHAGELHIKRRLLREIQSLPALWQLSDWIGMALPVLERDFCPMFDAYRVQIFDLILVCALPFTQILIIHGTAGVVVQCQSDVPSIPAL